MEKLKEDIEKYSDAYLSERAKRLGVCVSCVWYAIKRLSITYKKRYSILNVMLKSDQYLNQLFVTPKK